MKDDLFKNVRVYPTIHILKRYQKKEYEKMKKESSDRLVVIAGYEGTGKSFLQLELHEHWTMKVLKMRNIKKAFETFCFKDIDWAKTLVECKDKPYMMITHDEAVNLAYRKEANTKKNKAINKSFKKFRGKKWYHTWLIPQVHRLDKELVEDRVRRLLFVFKHNGERYVAVYSKKRLDSLIAEISRMQESTARDVKSRPDVLNCDTNPLFICKIPMYEGKFLKYYHGYKEENMDESVDEVWTAVEGKNNKTVEEHKSLDELKREQGTEMLNEGMRQADIAHLLKVSVRTVERWSQRNKKAFQVSPTTEKEKIASNV